MKIEDKELLTSKRNWEAELEKLNKMLDREARLAYDAPSMSESLIRIMNYKEIKTGIKMIKEGRYNEFLKLEEQWERKGIIR